MSAPDELPDVRATTSEIDEAVPRPPRPARRRQEPAAPVPVKDVEPPQAVRFHIFTGVLIALAIAAVTATVLVATGGGGGGDGPRWSAFRPASDGLDSGAREIADYVGRRYRLPDGRQIVAVTGGPLELEGLPMRIAIRESPGDGGDIRLLDGGGVLYRMCGLGPKCSIATGKPSPDRTLLLRREALELALYAFHDLKGVDNVVVLLPPPKGEDPSVAMQFRRGDVAGQLARPLRATLPSRVPNPDTIKRSPETPFVRSLTFANMFKFSLTQANQDAAVFLVLDPLPTAA